MEHWVSNALGLSDNLIMVHNSQQYVKFVKPRNENVTFSLFSCFNKCNFVDCCPFYSVKDQSCFYRLYFHH